MKIKSDFVLRQIAQNYVVLPLAAETVNFNGMLTLNESGVMLWHVLEKGGDCEALVKALTEEYEVTEEQARADAEAFLDRLIQYGCVEL